MGERIERLVPNPRCRRELFSELDGYIRPVLDHMTLHSEMPWKKYLEERERLRPFNSDTEGQYVVAPKWLSG